MIAARQRSRLTLAMLANLLGATAGGCGTDARGVEACREIEAARCQAAPYCGDRFDIGDREHCERFYDGQCLHGLASSANPGAPRVDACVADIEALGRCAQQDGEALPARDCDEIESSLLDSGSVCEVLEHPEWLESCAFIVPKDDPSDPPKDSAAGAGGAAGDDDKADASNAGAGTAADGQ